jgi:glycerophosphoryl diester phosphodiesterase
MIAGHRGLPLEYPDNTKEGILAAAVVCDMVEFDVRRTRDGVAVLSHDARVGGSLIIDMDWPALEDFDLGGGFHLARLDDVLQAAGEFPFNFEIKNSPADPDFDETFEFAVEAAGRASKRDVVTSFHWPTVDAVRNAYPSLSTGLLVDPMGSVEAATAWATRSGHRVIALHWSLLGDQPAARTAEITKTGLRVVVWTVNDEDIARNVAAGGAAAIITDDPIRIGAALRGRRDDEHQG